MHADDGKAQGIVGTCRHDDVLYDNSSAQE